MYSEDSWFYEQRWYFIVGGLLIVAGILWGIFAGATPTETCYLVARSESDIHADKTVQTVDEAIESLQAEGLYPEYNQRYLTWSSRVGGGRITHGYSDDPLASWWNLPSCLSK